MNKETLYIIDISNMMHRAFHVHKHLGTSSGFPTGAIYGTFTMLYKWIQDVHPKNILVCYDWQGDGSVRKNIYAQYKANRVQVNATMDLICLLWCNSRTGSGSPSTTTRRWS